MNRLSALDCKYPLPGVSGSTPHMAECFLFRIARLHSRMFGTVIVCTGGRVYVCVFVCVCLLTPGLRTMVSLVACSSTARCGQ